MWSYFFVLASRHVISGIMYRMSPVRGPGTLACFRAKQDNSAMRQCPVRPVWAYFPNNDRRSIHYPLLSKWPKGLSHLVQSSLGPKRPVRGPQIVKTPTIQERPLHITRHNVTNNHHLPQGDTVLDDCEFPAATQNLFGELLFDPEISGVPQWRPGTALNRFLKV